VSNIEIRVYPRANKKRTGEKFTDLFPINTHNPTFPNELWNGVNDIRRKHFPHVSYGSRLCEKSVVQFACRTSASLSSIRKPIALATSVGRRQLRKQFCASLAHATFHTGWVKNGRVRARAARPFYPQEQTSSACPSMSVWCRPNPDIAASFDHVVGDCEHFIWNDKAKRPGGLAVDDEIKFGWLLDRQIAGLRPT
jgi:hypothetical protein